MSDNKKTPTSTQSTSRPVTIGTYKNEGKMPATIRPATGPKPSGTSRKK